jgi:hypothetical protein|tara:strand:+ start:468 stop:635 length:168 start_codon:yes stop_codon:yes gene_type:complete
MEVLVLWLSVITVLFIMESALVLYFVKWILWRWNGSIQELLVSHYSNSPSDKEEE